jgi:hypothetical protein
MRARFQRNGGRSSSAINTREPTAGVVSGFLHLDPSSPKELTHPFDELPTGQSIGFNFGDVTLVDCGQRFTWGEGVNGSRSLGSLLIGVRGREFKIASIRVRSVYISSNVGVASPMLLFM